MSSRLEARISRLETIETDGDALAQFGASLKALDDGLPDPYPNASNAPLLAALRELEAEERSK